MGVNSLWFKWKSLKLPWRKMWLAGQDLSGNTFWEFKDALNAARFRRIVKANPKTHLADVKVCPQWHQWLRHVRPQAPTLEELISDVHRQQRLQQLAQLANERWASKPSYLDMPTAQQQARQQQAQEQQQEEMKEQQQQQEQPEREPVTVNVRQDEQKDRRPAAPSERWQPESWTPTAARKR